MTTTPPTRTDEEARDLLAAELERLAPRRDALGEEGVFAVAGYTLLQAFEWEGSLLAWQRVLELTPDNVEAVFSVGVCLLELGRHDEAADRFREAIALDERRAGDPDREQLDWFEEDPYYKLGTALHAKGDLDAAAEAYEESARRNITGVDSLTELARCHLARRSPAQALEALDRLKGRSVRLSVRATVHALRAQAQGMMKA